MENTYRKNSSRAAEIQASSLIVSRHCALPMSKVVKLNVRSPLADLCKADSFLVQRDSVRESLTERLFDEITGSPDQVRTCLIKLRRNIHNDRRLDGNLIDSAFSSLSSDLQIDIKNFNQSFTSEEEQRLIAEKNFTKFLTSARNCIAELAGEEEFQKGVQLSRTRTLKDVKKYCTQIASKQKINKKIRQIELSIVSFLYRMSLKPSPFGAFTRMEFSLPSEYENALLPTKGSLYRRTLASRMLILLGADKCLLNSEIAQNVPLIPNLSIMEEDGCLSYFSRGAEGSFFMYGKERFMKLKASAAVKSILDLAESGASKKKIVAWLDERGVGEQKAHAIVSSLIDSGALSYRLQVPDASLYCAGELASILRDLPSEDARTAAKYFDDIDEIERAFAQASVEERSALIELAHDKLSKILEVAGSEPVAKEEIRNYFYEDIGCLSDRTHEERSLPKEIQHDLADFTPIVSLFDEMLVEKLSLYDFFEERYANDDSDIGLLDFYKEFSNDSPENLDKRVRGDGSLKVAEVIRLRGEWIAEVWRKIRESEGSSEPINLADSWAKEFVDKLPDYVMPLKSVSFYCQNIGKYGTEGVVLNGACMGHGAAFARFLSIFDESDTFAKAIRDTQLRMFPDERHMDITAVLGTNTNLHPPVWGEQFEYPGSIADPKSGKILRSIDLNIRADKERSRLVLVSKETGEKIHFSPLNFLYPTIGPSYYRFLNLISPYTNFRNSTWLLYLNRFFKSTEITLPRIVFNKVVLQRRCHLLGPKTMQALSAFEPLTLKGMSEIDAWRRSVGLPINAFFRGINNETKGSEKGWQSGVNNIINKSQEVRMRKPHFIDFSNPFLCRILQTQLSSDPNVTMIFEECVPETAQYGDIESTASAEEFIYQLDIVW